MAGFRITKPYTMPKAKLRAAAKGLARDLEQQHGVRSHWEGDKVHISGAGINGEMSIANGVIDVSVKLGLIASIFEKPLRREVQRYLDEYIS